MKPNTLLISVILLLVLTGCERYENVEIEVPYKPKVVTACFLQSGSLDIHVAVSRSQPVFNTSPQPGFEPAPVYIKDATVMFQQGFNIYFLNFDSMSNFYQATLPSAIKAGEKYDITVTSGNETCKGTTTIPSKLNANVTVQFDSTLLADGLYQYRATVTCTPVSPGKHYLEFYPILYWADSTQPDVMYSQMFNTITELSQGQSVTKTYVSTISVAGQSPERLELVIVSGDAGYAKNTNMSLDVMSGFALSPFINPAITYTNISGGIGIIGSFNPETRYIFDLK